MHGMRLKCTLAETSGPCPVVNSSLFSRRTPLSGVAADCSHWMLYNGVGWHTWAREGGEWEWVGLKPPGCAVLPPGGEATSSSRMCLLSYRWCRWSLYCCELPLCVCDLIRWLVKAVAIDLFSSVFSQRCCCSPGILKSGPLLQSLALTVIKHTWAC